MESLRIDFGDVSLEVHRYSSVGRLVCMLPGLGGGVDRFAVLGRSLALAGCQPVAINPRGAGNSTGPLEGLRMGTLAADVAQVIRRLGPPAVVVGNAFGSRIARVLAASDPELVDSLVLVCAGGEVPPDAAAKAAMGVFIDESRPEAERLAAARVAFFAQGNDVAPEFLDSARTPEAVASQIRAMRMERDDSWLEGGRARMLVIQGAEDRISPPANGHRLRERWPERVQVVDVPRAGHAVLLERPGAVADAIIDFLRGDRAVEMGGEARGRPSHS